METSLRSIAVMASSSYCDRKAALYCMPTHTKIGTRLWEICPHGQGRPSVSTWPLTRTRGSQCCSTTSGLPTDEQFATASVPDTSNRYSYDDDSSQAVRW